MNNENNSVNGLTPNAEVPTNANVVQPITEENNAGNIPENSVPVQPNTETITAQAVETPQINTDNIAAQPAVETPQPQPVVENGNQPISNSDGDKKKKSGIIIGSVVAIIAIVAVLVPTLLKSPKTVFIGAIDKAYNGINKLLDVNKYDSAKSSVKMSFDLKSEDSEAQQYFDIFNKLSIDCTTGIDSKNKVINMAFNTNYDGSTLANLKVYGENAKIYLFLENIYDKYIMTDVEGYDELFADNSESVKDIKQIFNSTEKAITGALKKQNYSKSNATVKVDGKDVKVTKNDLKLDDKTIKSISIDVLTTLKNDKDFIKALNNNLSKDEQIKESDFDDAIASVKEGEFSDEITLSIYTTGLLSKFVQFDLTSGSDVLTILEEKDGYTLKATEDGKDLFTANVTVTGDMSNYKSVVNVEVPQLFTAKINLEGSTKYNEKIDKLDVSNSVDYQSLTDQDMATIYQNILSNEGIANLMQMIESMNV